MVDSVKALLAPGEEVIRTSSAMLFRPLLKDINDNAGRLWSNFSLAVNKLGSVTAYQEDVSDEFYKTIQELDKNLKDDILRRKVTAIGGVAMGTRGTTRAQVKPSPKKNEYSNEIKEEWWNVIYTIHFTDSKINTATNAGDKEWSRN